MKIFMIRDQDGNSVKTYKKTWYYKTLGAAKTAAKCILRHKNKQLDRASRVGFDYLKVIECEVVIKDIHPI